MDNNNINRWKEYIGELYDKENAQTVEDMSKKTHQIANLK